MLIWKTPTTSLPRVLLTFRTSFPEKTIVLPSRGPLVWVPAPLLAVREKEEAGEGRQCRRGRPGPPPAAPCLCPLDSQLPVVLLPVADACWAAHRSIDAPLFVLCLRCNVLSSLARTPAQLPSPHSWLSFTVDPEIWGTWEVSAVRTARLGCPFLVLFSSDFLALRDCERLKALKIMFKLFFFSFF